ncbi:MAG: phytanoyl-CoA dioxygenase family protein [Candidatus Sumerlaeaceae bacterium]
MTTVLVPPTALSWEQKIAYDTNGYLVFENFLSANELSELSAAFDCAYKRWEADTSLPGTRKPNERQILGIIEYNDIFLHLLAHSRMFPIVRELVGDDISMVDNDGHVKPGDSVSHISWHHDVAQRGVYHPMSTLMVKVFYLLTDTEPNGGVTAFMPGSHRYPDGYPFPQVENPEEMPGHVRMSHKAGTAYLFNGRVYHAAFNNYTANDRKAIIMNYGHFWMKPWAGYEPSEALKTKAHTPELRQLLHIGDAYTQALS